MTTSIVPATVWALSDGRAGNARQAEALAAAIARLVGDRFDAHVLTPRAPWRWWAPRRAPMDAAAFGDAFGAALRRPPRVAIGCGRQAALATRLLGARGARTVQILDPRLPPAHWDVVIAPEHDGLRGGNVVASHGALHPVDDAWLARGRASWPTFAALPSPRVGLLVGGPSPHARIDDAGFARTVDAVCAAVRAHGGSLLVTASRRTPAPWRAHVRAARGALPGLAWTGDDDGPNPYAGLLGWADALVVTADSVNMLSEAAATQAPLHVLCADALRGRPRGFLDALVASGRASAFDGRTFGPAAPVVPLRETDRIAADVCVRLGLR